jgi:hypothetical protein
MVEQFGMSHYFVILLIIDEMSSLCWEQIIDIEIIVKYLHASLNWKDCLIECAILFMGQQIHATTFIISTHAFTWHYKRICNML